MQTDTWWQLRAGRDMWSSRQVLLTDTYSHTANGAFWPNHEWLAEVIFYVTFSIGGLPLLTLFAAALITGGWGVSWRLTRAGGVRQKFLLTGLALVPSASWWEPRPHAFSLLFIPTIVLLMARDRMWWLPVVFLIWANVHGGVLLGLVLLATGLIAQTLVEPVRWRRSALMLAACVLAVTATPLGLSFWIEIPRSLNRISQYTLDEWRRPGFAEAAMVPFWIIAAGFCAAVIRNARRLRTATPGETVLFACAIVLLPAAFSAVRHVGPFLMIAVPALTHLVTFPSRRRSASEERPLANLALGVAACAAVAATLAWAYWNRVDRLRWAPMPDGALTALQQCPDNLYNRYDEGAYLLWFAPDRKVFLDGRQDPYPSSLVREHIEIERGQRDHEAVFARHGIHCAYLPNASPVARRLSAAGWQALYRDSRWVVLRDPSVSLP